MQPDHPQLEGLETRRLFAFGKTDTTFGDQGRTEAAVDNANGSQATKDLLVTSGGKIIAGGDAGLIRFNSDGSLDDTFGTSGTVRTNGFSFKAEAVDGSGNVFDLGRGFSGTLVLKYSSTGAFSTSFGTRGSALVDATSLFRPSGIALQADGKIVVAGTLFNKKETASSSRVYRLNTDGTLDNTFGTAGAADVQLGQAPLLTPNLHDTVKGVIVLASGKILVAGGSYSSSDSFSDPEGNFIDSSFGQAVFAVARLNADGTIDSSYAAAGVSRVAYANADTVASLGGVLPSAVGLQSDGAVFLGAFDTSPVVTRIAPDGSEVFTTRPDEGTAMSTPVDLIGLSGQRIGVLARPGYRSEYGFVMATIDVAGNFSNEVRTDDLNPETSEFSPFSAGALAIASDGKLLVGGESGEFIIGKYTAGTASDPRPDDFPNATVNDIIKDDLGALYLAYFDPSSKSLKFAYRAPNGLWNATVTVDPITNSGEYLSIALHRVNKGTVKDPNFVQEPSIAYFAGSSGDLKLAESVDTGAHFTLQTAASKGSVGLYPTLLYDSKDRATVSFYNRTTADAMFGQVKDGVWHFETIDTAGDVGRDIVLDVRPDGRYAVAYVDTTNKNVKYAVQGMKGVWNSEVADSTTGGAKFVSLDHSDDFGPAISYFDVAKEDLNFAYFRKSKWKRQVIATTGNPGLFSRVEFRYSFGDPTVFAWASFPNKVVKYTNIVESPIDQTVFNGGGRFLSVDWDGTEQDFAFLDTSSNNLHVRAGPGPD